ncbi:MAG: RnfH family protein [Limnobacter sp.]|uniref:RnfH family protein n=2 Tax=Burkholderiaceae TaxID=119060 RepID=A0ABX6N9K7_9BURK|nr:RnfH family protein [Sutterellaceae bacterium]MBA4314583.1 RnfH family protein [Alcaligenaceae bacterium]PZO19257.1 MAG: RnfH family protein [Betaproteobacteria bacterium]QJR31108.1 RnfH family protein [Limnobacter sp. SAORIC-580]RZO91473.1 MAG: RnfH family protein [Limnobacter sp.]
MPKPLNVPEKTTVEQALQAIGLSSERIALLLKERAVAVYGLYATEGMLLHPGDRIEILDGLSFDPMESRRRRAQHKVLTKRQKELAKYERRSRKQSKTVP